VVVIGKHSPETDLGKEGNPRRKMLVQGLAQFVDVEDCCALLEKKIETVGPKY
jgi:hypothetical protein